MIQVHVYVRRKRKKSDSVKRDKSLHTNRKLKNRNLTTQKRKIVTVTCMFISTSALVWAPDGQKWREFLLERTEWSGNRRTLCLGRWNALQQIFGVSLHEQFVISMQLSFVLFEGYTLAFLTSFLIPNIRLASQLTTYGVMCIGWNFYNTVLFETKLFLLDYDP